MVGIVTAENKKAIKARLEVSNGVWRRRIGFRPAGEDRQVGL
jgi:hypothetical protein